MKQTLLSRRGPLMQLRLALPAWPRPTRGNFPDQRKRASGTPLPGTAITFSREARGAYVQLAYAGLRWQLLPTATKHAGLDQAHG